MNSETAPIVSLIICVYNAETTLPQTLDSVLAQTFEPLEVLCVNDAATDGSLNVVKQYAGRDRRIRIIDLPKNKGLLAARKTGVLSSRGQYIMFLDDDDLLVPTACAELVEIITREKTDIVQFGAEVFFENGVDEAAKRNANSFFEIRHTGSVRGSDNIMDRCFCRNDFTWNVWNKIYRAELSRSVYQLVPDDAHITQGEDLFAFFIAATKANSLFITPTPYYRYRYGRGCSTRSGNSFATSFNRGFTYYCEIRRLRKYLKAENKKMTPIQEQALNVIEGLLYDDAYNSGSHRFRQLCSLARNIRGKYRKVVSIWKEYGFLFLLECIFKRIFMHVPREKSKSFSIEYAVIRGSDLFDAEMYRREHGVELQGMDPVSHYILVGAEKGYLPSLKFDDAKYKKFYVDLNPDVLGLYHYLRWGKNEGRHAFPVESILDHFYPAGFDTEGFGARKDKILVATHQLDYSGVPILSRMLAGIFAKDGNVAMISPEDGPLRDSCLKSGIPVIIDSDFYFDENRAVFYRQEGFVFCMFTTLGIVTTYLRTAPYIPSAIWINENAVADSLPKAVRDKIKSSQSVFATSKITTGCVGTYVDHVRFLPYPVRDMGKHAKTSVPVKFRFGVFGVYDKRKGQDIAIEAFKSMPDELRRKAELLLIGDSFNEEYSEGLKNAAAGEDGIKFIDAQRDATLYHRMYEDDIDVQICPSRTDPMPLVVFDGMMHGCPVILSDKVGQVEFIKDGDGGYIFASEDAGALSQCMTRMVSMPERFPEMSRKARQIFLDHCDPQKAEKTIREIIREITMGNP